jgi:phage terminase Nu1 subunit (DNA packaging protein)
MKKVSKTDFADMCGVSKAAISKACAAGNIKTIGEGRKQKVDVDHRLTKDYLSEKVGSSSANQSRDELLPSGDQMDLPISDINAINRDEILLYEKPQLERLKLFEQAKLENIKVAEKEGTLISRELVERVFSKIYTVDTQQLRPLEDVLTPEICAIFGAQDDSPEGAKVRKKINEKVLAALDHIKRIIDEYLISIGSDKL